MFLERFDKTCKDHFESFRFLLIGYSNLKFWTENIVQMFQEQLILPVQMLFLEWEKRRSFYYCWREDQNVSVYECMTSLIT